MELPNFETYLVATTVSDGNGMFHPGLRHGHNVYYWPNRKFLNEDLAAEAAQFALADALAAANSVISAWNLVTL